MNPGDERELTPFRVDQAALLEREAAAARLNVPRAFKALESDLQKASARIRACWVEDPFREERLRSIPPVAVRAAVEEARKAGLMTDGTEWTVRRDHVPALAEGIQNSFQRHLDLDRDLPGIARGI